jgi:hypothetical protein
LALLPATTIGKNDNNNNNNRGDGAKTIDSTRSPII